MAPKGKHHANLMTNLQYGQRGSTTLLPRCTNPCYSRATYLQALQYHTTTGLSALHITKSCTQSVDVTSAGFVEAPVEPVVLRHAVLIPHDFRLALW